MRKLLNSQIIKNKTVILFRLSALGDVCLTTGLIAYLNRVYDCNFVIITKKSFSPIFANNPAIKEVLSLDKQDLKFKNYFKLCSQLAKKYQDNILIDLHHNIRSKILSFFWKNEVYTYPKYKLERLLFLYFRDSLAQKRLLQNNVLERYSLALFQEKIPREYMPTTLFLSEAEEEQAQKLILTSYNSIEKLVIIHPYASYTTKNWLTESWQELCDLLTQAKINFLIIGLGQSFIQTKTKYDLTNQTSLRQTMALIKTAKVFVSSDSGPMHFATALNTKLIALFGPTTEEWGFYPTSQKQKIFANFVSCRPCSLHGSKACKHNYLCHKSISVQAVFKEIQKSLA